MTIPKSYLIKLTGLLLLFVFLETHAQSSQSISANQPPAPNFGPGGPGDDVDDEAPLPINGYLTLGLLAGAFYGFKVLKQQGHNRR